FSTNGQGMTVLATNEENVNAMQRGVIIFAGNDKDYGKTIVVQHANNSTTTYGQLKDVDVHTYETVEAGDRIGKASKAKVLYVQMELNNTYMHRLEVVQVDDSRLYFHSSWFYIFFHNYYFYRDVGTILCCDYDCMYTWIRACYCCAI